MNLKLGKEKSVVNDKSFRVKYGTINSTDLESIYLRIESWVQPSKKIDDTRYISKLRRDICLIINETNNFFKPNYIMDLDLRSSGLSVNKKSFMSIDITFFNKSCDDFNSDELQTNILDIFGGIRNVLVDKEFSFHSKKVTA